MKKLWLTIVIIVCFITSYSQTKPDFEWLIGDWKIGEMEGSSITIYERWKKSSCDSYTGEGFVLNGKDTIVKEAMRIERINGFWCFIAQVNNGNPVLFTLTPGSTATQLVFENMEHDNPQRVIYKFVSKSQIHARTEALVDGKEVADDYPFSRY